MNNPFTNNPFGNIMQQMQKAQANFAQIQDELAKETITAEAGAGMVKIISNGNGEALSVEIDDDVYKEEKIVLQDLLASAINDLSAKRKRLKDAKMKQLMTELGLPANFDFNLPFMN